MTMKLILILIRHQFLLKGKRGHRLKVMNAMVDISRTRHWGALTIVHV